jgi:hypothetical protein
MKRAKLRRAPKATWYGVKTFFRTTAVGRPMARDSAYDARLGTSNAATEQRVAVNVAPLRSATRLNPTVRGSCRARGGEDRERSVL